MELEKKTPSTFTPPQNDASKPLGGDAAMGVPVAKITIEQRQTSGGNANTMKGLGGNE